MSFTAVVLDRRSREALVAALDIPEGWEVVAHHMTINMGPPDAGPAGWMFGWSFIPTTGPPFAASLEVTHVGRDNRVLAVAVETSVPSRKVRKHVTVAVNVAAGGKPEHSDTLPWSAWVPLGGIPALRGTVRHVRQ